MTAIDTATRVSYRYEFQPHEHAAIKACHDEHGFAIVKRMIDAALIEEMKRDVLRVLVPADDLKRGDARFHPAFIEHAPSMWALLDHPRYMALYAHLIGDEDLVVHRSAAFVKAAGSGGQNWHSDARIGVTKIKDGNDVLNVFDIPNGFWFYLTGSSPEHGGLAIIPGSHRPDWPGPGEGWILSEDRGGFRRAGSQVPWTDDMDVPGAMPVVTEPGDLVIFAARTFHGVYPNASDRTRLSCAFVMRPRSIRVNAPWPLGESARKFMDALPAHLKRYVDGYTGIGKCPPT